ncbi:MAG: polysaccharide pyruvyl transferase family protein [Patescibacteria group bacterium]
MGNDHFVKRDAACFTAAISKFVGPSASYALLDFPAYPNVGDSLIWLGTTKALKRVTGVAPRYISAQSDFDGDCLRRRLSVGDTIFVLGGGNFGDLWPSHQHFREDLLARFAEFRIVQLPQSIQFNSADAAQRAKKAIKLHPDFHLMVRDLKSQEFAINVLEKKPALVADGAMVLGRLERSDATQAVQYLLRTDKESPRDDESIKPNEAVDWVAEPTGFPWSLNVPQKLQALAGGALSSYDRTAILRERQAEYRMRKGAEILGKGSVVVTDRLHGHILCLLLDIPHVVIDNLYGKISGYIECFTKDYSGFRVARNLREAQSLVPALVEVPSAGLGR